MKNRNVNIALAGLFLVGGILALGIVGPSQSIAQGNVYDIYKTTPSGVTTLVRSCQSFSQIQADQNNDPMNSYSGNPDPSCGPIVVVTQTVVSSTTFTNAGNQTCPPAGAPVGYAYVCEGRTITVVSNTTSTSTATIQTTTTTMITLTQSGTTTLVTATKPVVVSSSGLSGFQWLGVGISAFGLVGLVVVNRRKVTSGL